MVLGSSLALKTTVELILTLELNLLLGSVPSSNPLGTAYIAGIASYQLLCQFTLFFSNY